jgi:hypothetical protein
MAAVAQEDEREARVAPVAIHNGGCSSAMAIVVVDFLLDEIPLPSPVLYRLVCTPFCFLFCVHN